MTRRCPPQQLLPHPRPPALPADTIRAIKRMQVAHVDKIGTQRFGFTSTQTANAVYDLAVNTDTPARIYVAH